MDAQIAQEVVNNIPNYYREFGWLGGSNLIFLGLFVLIVWLAWRYLSNNITTKLNIIIENQSIQKQLEVDREARLIEKINLQNEKITTLLTGVNVIVKKTLLGDDDEDTKSQ
jgi:hypothetical protein